MRPKVANDGWVKVELDGEATVYVRVASAGAPVIEDLGGGYTLRKFPIIATALLVEAPEVTTDLLRRLQPTRILAAVGDWEYTNAAGKRRTIPSDELLWMNAGSDHDDDQTTLADLRSRPAGKVDPKKRTPVGRPDGRDPSAFYLRFAKSYRSAATESSKPAVLLAEENGVPIQTVRRWIVEARRRGFLEPARKGRAG